MLNLNFQKIIRQKDHYMVHVVQMGLEEHSFIRSFVDLANIFQLPTVGQVLCWMIKL